MKIAAIAPIAVILVTTASAENLTEVRQHSAADDAKNAAPAQTLIRSSLPNGLRVVIAPDPKLPIVSVSVAYGVGGNDDPPGRDGLAHLVEHIMARAGSRQVGDGEFSELVIEAGGYSTGTTDMNYTHYAAVIPSNQLEMVLFMEADRMRGLQFNEGVVESEKRTVQNERGRGLAATRLLVFPSPLLAKIASEGRRQELTAAASVSELRSFYDRFYQPSNAVIAVTGDVDPEATSSLIARYFGGINDEGRPARELVAPVPQRQAFVQPSRKSTRLYMAYRLPEGKDLDDAVVELLVRVLNAADTDSLRRRLEARGVTAGPVLIASRLSSEGRFLVIEATPADGRTAEEVEAVVLDELSRKQPSDASSLEQAQNVERLRHAGNWLAPDARAQHLARAELLQGDARRFVERDAAILATSVPTIERMVSEYLAKTPELIAIARPERQP